MIREITDSVVRSDKIRHDVYSRFGRLQYSQQLFAFVHRVDISITSNATLKSILRLKSLCVSVLITF